MRIAATLVEYRRSRADWQRQLEHWEHICDLLDIYELAGHTTTQTGFDW